MVLCWLFATPFIGAIGYLVLRFLWELIPVRGLKEKAVFITGCDSGFGRVLALKCAKKGITVFAGCMTQQGQKELEKEAASFPLKTVSLNVTDDDSVEKARKYVGQHLNGKKLWAVVNNAGIFSCYGPADWCTVDEYKLAFDVNALGVIRCTNAFLDLIKASHGRVITVSSTLGRITLPGGAPYCVSKYAVESYIDAIRRELKPWGVSCSILEPGGCKTTQLLDDSAMTKRVNSVWQKLKPALKEEYGEDFKESYIRWWNEGTDHVATKLNDVVDNYYHAITAAYPRLRYHCGWDAILMLIPASLLPTFFEDLFVDRFRSNNILPPKCFRKQKTN